MDSDGAKLAAVNRYCEQIALAQGVTKRQALRAVYDLNPESGLSDLMREQLFGRTRKEGQVDG